MGGGRPLGSAPTLITGSNFGIGSPLSTDLEGVIAMKERTTRRRRIQTTLPPEALARIDALILRFSEPGRPATQAEILRDLVRLGLAELDKAEARGKPHPRRPRPPPKRRP